MKSITEYIKEEYWTSTSTHTTDDFKDKKANKIKVTNENVNKVVRQEIKKLGDKANLNHIDVSEVTDMTGLFEELVTFNGDISEWDVSNVEIMSDMFYNCRSFNGDITKWNTGNVVYMNGMFYGCTKFNRDISKWDVGRAKESKTVFMFCDIPNKYKPAKFR